MCLKKLFKKKSEQPGGNGLVITLCIVAVILFLGDVALALYIFLFNK